MRLVEAFLRDVVNGEQVFDYGARTDGQPVYYGATRETTDTSVKKWVIHYFEYNISGFVTAIHSREGAWADRATLFI